MASDNDITVRRRRCKDVFDGDLAHYIPGSSEDALTYSKKAEWWAIKWPDETGDGKVDALDYSSKKWAVYTDGPVDADNNLFSSKWYAQYAEIQANISITWANKSQEWAESDNVIEGTDNSYSSKHWSGVSKDWADASLSYSIAADNSRLLAFEWAEKMSGPVTGDQYSAKYWAGKAKEQSGDSESWSVVSHKWANGGRDEGAVEPSSTDTNSSLYWAYRSHQHEINAGISEDNAAESKRLAGISEGNAKTSEDNAAESKRLAGISEGNAKTSEDNAKTSEVNAATSESNAKGSEEQAKIWAIGLPEEPLQHSAKYWALDSENSATAAENWAIKTSGPVQGSEYSAKKHAIDAENSAGAAAVSAASAKNWAEDDALHSAKHWATEAGTSASNASTSAEKALEWAESDTVIEGTEDSHSAKYYAEHAGEDEALAKDWASKVTTPPSKVDDTYYSANQYAINAGASATAALISETNAAQSAQDSLDTYGLTATVYSNTVEVYNNATEASLSAQEHANDAESYQEGAWDNYQASITERQLAQEASGKAADWAVKTDGLVEGTDYSSKHYALLSQLYSETAQLAVDRIKNPALRNEINVFTKDNQFDGNVSIGQPGTPGDKAKCQLNRTSGSYTASGALIDNLGRCMLITYNGVGTNNKTSFINYINNYSSDHSRDLDITASAADGDYIYIEAKVAGTYANEIEYYAVGSFYNNSHSSTVQGTTTPGTDEVKAQCIITPNLTSYLASAGSIVYKDRFTGEVKGIGVAPAIDGTRTLQDLADLINADDDLDFTAEVSGSTLLLTNKEFGADSTTYYRTGCFNNATHLKVKQGTVTPGTEDIPGSGNTLTLNGESVPTHFGNNEYVGINIFTGPVGIQSTGSFTNNGVTVLNQEAVINGDTVLNGSVSGTGINNFADGYRMSSPIINFEDMLTAGCTTAAQVKEVVPDWNTRNNWKYLLSEFTGNLSDLFGQNARSSTATGDYLYIYAPKVTSGAALSRWCGVKKAIIILPNVQNISYLFGDLTPRSVKDVVVIAPKATNNYCIFDWATYSMESVKVVVGSFNSNYSQVLMWFTLYGSCAKIKQLSINDSALVTRTELNYLGFTGLEHHVVKLPALVTGDLSYCKLDKESVLSIVNSLKAAGDEETCTLKIGILAALEEDDEVQAALTNLETPVVDGGKGWTVTVTYK